jgi:hypothetical protein
MAKKNKSKINLKGKHDYWFYLGIFFVVALIGAILFFADSWTSGDVAGQATRKTLPPAYDATKCYDSDGGAKADVKGKIIGPLLVPGSPTEDMCVGDNLREMVCKNNKGTSVLLSCGNDKLCDNGVCINVCQDSDGGNNPKVKGKISGALEEPNVKTEDYCLDSNTLIEAYCNGYKKGITLKHVCDADEICQDGACVIVAQQPPASDLKCNTPIEYPTEIKYTQKIEFTSTKTGIYINKNIENECNIGKSIESDYNNGKYIYFKDSSTYPMYSYSFDVPGGIDYKALIGKAITLQGVPYVISLITLKEGQINAIDLINGTSSWFNLNAPQQVSVDGVAHSFVVTGAEAIGEAADPYFNMSCGFKFDGAEYWIDAGNSLNINKVMVNVIETKVTPQPSCKLVFGNKITIRKDMEVLINEQKIKDITDFYAQGIINTDNNGKILSVGYKLNPNMCRLYLGTGEYFIDPLLGGFKIQFQSISPEGKAIVNVMPAANAGGSFAYDLALDESMSAKKALLLKTELPNILGDGTVEKSVSNLVCVKADEKTGSKRFQQKIVFENPNTGVFVNNNGQGTTGNFIYLKKGTEYPLYRYGLYFDSTQKQGYLIGKKLSILNRNYYVTEAFSTGNEGKITLVEGDAVWLSEGQKYNYGPHVIELTKVGGGSACKVKVDGIETSLEFSTPQYINTIAVGVLDINLAYPKYVAKLALGTKIIKISQNNVEVNGKDITSTTDVNGKFVFDKYSTPAPGTFANIGYSVNPLIDMYLTPGNEFVDPVFGGFKIIFKQVSPVGNAIVNIGSAYGNDIYEFGNNDFTVGKSINQIDDWILNYNLPYTLSDGYIE